MICKRCGDEGHQAKTCRFPPLGRPDIERLMRGKHMVTRETVGRILKYVYDLEASRRRAIEELQRRMSAGPGA